MRVGLCPPYYQPLPPSALSAEPIQHSMHLSHIGRAHRVKIYIRLDVGRTCTGLSTDQACPAATHATQTTPSVMAGSCTKKDRGSHKRRGAIGSPSLSLSICHLQFAVPYSTQRQCSSRHACIARETCPSTLPCSSMQMTPHVMPPCRTSTFRITVV